MRVLDLCTEFGSEVQAFKDRGHEVKMLGLDGDVDIRCDVRQYYPHVDDKYDFIICHPPCTGFSLANYRLGACKDRNPDLSIVWACFRIIETLVPKYWILENPRGCLKYFIGEPSYKINYSDFGFASMKPTYLWGSIPMFNFCTPNKDFKPWKDSVPRNPKKRALLPYGLSLAICKAIENDMGLMAACQSR